ncbi:MAG: rhodanese-like domain-containing protein [Candidatus Heimdallarchaeota archaeon]|nr:rhodanese-like domain-containing protein [Candidatus Heimdallarchaeota archaeon]
MKKYLPIILFLLFLIPSSAAYTDISVADAKAMIEEGDVFILDVRSQSEYDEGHIDGATLIPVDELEDRLDELPAKDAKILVYCRSGSRSATASGILDDFDFTNVYNMLGGYIEWLEFSEESDSVTKDTTFQSISLFLVFSSMILIQNKRVK